MNVPHSGTYKATGKRVCPGHPCRPHADGAITIRHMIPADWILTSANLITCDDRQPRATAMAGYNGRLVYVGDDATASRFAGPHTRRLDLAGKTIVPGFCDAHVHLFWYGQQLLRQADLVGSQSIDEVLARLLHLAGRSEGWIQGHGFDQDKLADRRFPTRDDLDRVSRTRPIVISRICGPAAVANSAAIALLTPAERAAGDERSGLYIENDIGPFYRRIPTLDEASTPSPASPPPSAAPSGRRTRRSPPNRPSAPTASAAPAPPTPNSGRARSNRARSPTSSSSSATPPASTPRRSRSFKPSTSSSAASSVARLACSATY